jgi:uncharacterized RDD family membrane protein YckC
VEQNPYAPPSAQLATDAPKPAKEEALATLPSRFFASGFDTFIILVVTMVLGVVVFMFAPRAVQGLAKLGTPLQTAFGLGMYVLIHAIPLWQTGQTWGKRVFGIKVVTLEGKKPSLARLLVLRVLPVQLLALVPVVGVLGVAVDACAIFLTDDRQCLHDILAGTKVIKA